MSDESPPWPRPAGEGDREADRLSAEGAGRPAPGPADAHGPDAHGPEGSAEGAGDPPAAAHGLNGGRPVAGLPPQGEPDAAENAVNAENAAENAAASTAANAAGSTEDQPAGPSVDPPAAENGSVPAAPEAAGDPAGDASTSDAPSGDAPPGDASHGETPQSEVPKPGEPQDGEPQDGEPQDGEPQDSEPDLRAALEAILMVVDEPVPEVMLAQVLERPRHEVATALRELAAGYTAQGRGFDLRDVAGGWRFYTRPICAPLVERFVRDGQQARLTQAALETLAVVAYRQPVSRARVSAIRGVNSDGVMRTLTLRGLIEEAGQDPEHQAILYRTTTYFLERLGLRGLDELPDLAPFLPDDVAELEEQEP